MTITDNCMPEYTPDGLRVPVAGDTVSTSAHSGLFAVVRVSSLRYTVDMAVLNGLKKPTGHEIKNIPWRDLRYTGPESEGSNRSK